MLIGIKPSYLIGIKRRSDDNEDYVCYQPVLQHLYLSMLLSSHALI